MNKPVRDYEALQETANKVKLVKLKMNHHKKGFDEIAFAYALKRIKEETKELEVAIIKFGRIIRKKDYKPEQLIKSLEDVEFESADVGNFADMLILSCEKLKESYQDALGE